MLLKLTSWASIVYSSLSHYNLKQLNFKSKLSLLSSQRESVISYQQLLECIKVAFCYHTIRTMNIWMKTQQFDSDTYKQTDRHICRLIEQTCALLPSDVVKKIMHGMYGCKKM